jgi:signal transduction histidine kinase
MEEASLLLSFYGTTNTLISLLASFSFITIPFVLFTVQSFSLGLELAIDLMLVSFFSFFTLIILYHSLAIRTLPLRMGRYFVKRNGEPKVADHLFLIAAAVIPCALGCMFLVKGGGHWQPEGWSSIVGGVALALLADWRILGGYKDLARRWESANSSKGAGQPAS